MHLYGLPEQDWINDFDAAAVQESLRTPVLGGLNMDSILFFLQSIKKTYRQYIGDDDLLALKHFIDGYVVCLLNMGKSFPVIQYEEFTRFVGRHISQDLSDLSIYSKIINISSAKEDSFKLFFDLLDSFIQEIS